MKRKINQVGQNTLTVSLPNKWVVSNKLHKGDELEFRSTPKDITFFVGESKKEKKSITININNYDRFQLDRLMKVLYRNNYDHIILTYSNKILNDYKKKKYNIHHYSKKMSEKFIGMEIISQGENKTEFSSFILKDTEGAGTIEKRIYFLLKETLDNLINALGKDFHHFNENMYDYHDNITKFINYYLKIVDSLDISEPEKKQIYALYLLIDKVIDKIRHLSESIEKHGCTPRLKEFLIKVFSFLEEQFSSFFRKEVKIEILEKIKNLREDYLNNFNKEELLVAKDVELLLNLYNDFAETIITTKIEKGL